LKGLQPINVYVPAQTAQSTGACQVKVCIFTETYYPVMGGGETQSQLLAEGLIAGGHSVILLTRRSDAALKKRERYGSVDVYRLPPSGEGQLKKWGLLLSSLPMLIKLRDRYDLLFVSGYRIIGLDAILAGKLLGKPVILKADSQGEMSGEFFDGGLKKFGLSRTSLPFRWFLGIRNAILKKADAFSALSPEIASEWTSRGVTASKIIFIPNAVDTTHFVPVVREQKILLREKLKLSQNTVIAIYTGRLVSYKGLPLLLRAWKEICRSHKNVLLLLAGTGGHDIHNCESNLREYVKSADLEKDVRFLGAVRNIPEYLQAADLFVFPTENDTFPSSLVEAMACALPVVTTPVGGIKTIVTPGENGLLVEPGNLEQLYQALDVLLSNPEFASRLGQAALLTVREQYSAKKVTGNYLSLFQTILVKG
jgi:glycosyltransferase involved in cell wall biosynthesis